MSVKPMNTPAWRPEDGQLLQSLREKAGLDELVFARHNTVSLAQLRELEQGGESCFYNPQIKRSTGVKLLRKLGHERPAPLNAPVTADPTPTALPVATPAPADVSTLPASPASVHALTTAGPGLGAPSVSRGTSHPLWWGLGLSTLALLAIVGMNWPQTEPLGPPDQHWPASLAMAPAPTSATEPAASLTASALSAPAPASVQPESAALPAAAQTPGESANTVASLAAPQSALACDWQHRDASTVFQQTNPLKPGNYVHFVAQADTTLCVVDQNNKLTTLNLPAGAAKSVFGVPPFLVQSHGWQHLAVFFQGRRVPAAREGVQHLQLLSQAF